MELLTLDFMQRALLAALLIGLAAPAVGIFLVQRRLALVGDGLGHVALTGVALGLLTSTAPVLTALAAAVMGAVAIELMRAYARTSGDVALAILFYGGIAGGVVLVSRSPGGSAANLTTYLFGAITTTTPGDLVAFVVLTAVVLLLAVGLAPALFAVSDDEEYARASGLPVLRLNVLLAVLVAVTVVTSMRVVGLLLVSALMIVPNAVGQLAGRSFRSARLLAITVGSLCSVSGVVVSFYAGTPSGGTIVLLTIAVFVAVAVLSSVRSHVRAARHPRSEFHPHVHGPGCGHPAVPHDDHVDYVHDGHRHAPHTDDQGTHWDEHGTHPDEPGAQRDEHPAEDSR